MTRSRWAPYALVAAVVVAGAAAYGLRLGLIEPEAFGHLCAGGGPWWCAPRGALIDLLHTGVLGIGAAALGAVATLARRAGAALAAAMLGAAALALYDAELGAVGFLLGVLVLARSAAGGRRPERRPAEQ
ncbi:MAG: hypothetical protein M5U08_24150 [Burkholderiales bacterium]|nr:hypothetical protein [Burkholderiales bacterium]